MARTSSIRLAAVCWSASRDPIVPCALAKNVEEPSALVIGPFPSWSNPRPPSRNVVEVAPCCTVSVLLGPKPWPTTLIAMLAMPLCARTEATANGAPCLLSVNPWPKIARALCGNAVPLWHLRDEHVGVLPVRSTELSECQRANGAVEYLQRTQC